MKEIGELIRIVDPVPKIYGGKENMKKTLLVLLVLLVATGFTFALDAEFTGATSATWGYNLEDDSSGFVNSSDVRIEIGILEQGSTAQEGDDLYGAIAIEDFEITLLEDGTGPVFGVVDGDDDFTTYGSVSGTIYKGDLYMGIYSAPSFDYNNAEEIAAAATDVNPVSTTTGGVSFGMDDGTYAVELRVASLNDYDEVGTQNVDNYYTYGLDAELAFGDATVAFGVIYDNHTYAVDKNAYIGFSLAPSYEVGAIEAAVGFDAYLNNTSSASIYNDEGMMFDTRADFTFYVADENADEDRSGLTASVYFGGSTDADAPDVQNARLDAQVSFEEFTLDGLMNNLGFSVTAGMFDFLDEAIASADMTYAVDVTGEYIVAPGLKPYFGFGMGTDDYKTDLNVGLELGADLTGVDNTTFTLDYATDSLSDDTANAVVAHGGIFTVMAEISF